MSIESVARKVLACKKCGLEKSRTNTVLGEGSIEAKIVLVGEAPGREEDLGGRPFVGRAGKLLDTVLLKVGLKRDECYITNIIKCRPPDNRKPSRAEIRACYPYLKRQIKIINPVIVVCLGNTAAEAFFTKKNMPRRGFPTNQEEMAYLLAVHPAACLRNPEYLPLLETYLQRCAEYIRAKPKKIMRGLEPYIE